MRLFKSCPGSVNVKQPRPFEIECVCGENVEIWSDEAYVFCKSCHRKITRETEPSCVNWCPVAEECVGRQRFIKLKISRKDAGRDIKTCGKNKNKKRLQY